MVRWILALVVALCIGFFVYVKMNNNRPENLGVTDGLLGPCPTSPNCIATQALATDAVHYAAPISYQGDAKEAQLKLEQYFLEQARVNFIKSELGYLYVEVRSPIVGYIDDFEAYWPEMDNVIHLRSASRVGYSDMDVNRKRVESVRALFIE